MAVSLAGCCEAADITGSAYYRERIALPPNAVFEAVLLDVSKADVLATVLGRVVIDDIKGIPLEFAIPYDPGQIEQRLSYSVRATIKVQDQLWFTTDMHYPVLTQSNSDKIEILLKRVGHQSLEKTQRTQQE